MTCEDSKISSLPMNVPPFTDWIKIKKMDIGEFCTVNPYLSSEKGIISYLNIESSNIFSICDDTLKSVLHSRRLKKISFANNNLTSISKMWKTDSDHLERLWLGGNPIDCNCDMLWAMDWLENATGASGHRLVQDYQNVICATGPEAGTPVYKINRVKMECYPKHTPMWIIITACSVGGVILCIVVSILLIHRQWRLFRWLIYKNFDKLIGDRDRNEAIVDRQFDAFISFR